MFFSPASGHLPARGQGRGVASVMESAPYSRGGGRPLCIQVVLVSGPHACGARWLAVGGAPCASSLKPVAASALCCPRRFASSLFAAGLVTAASSLGCHSAVPRLGQSPLRPECGLCPSRPWLLCKGCSPNPAPAATASVGRKYRTASAPGLSFSVPPSLLFPFSQLHMSPCSDLRRVCVLSRVLC